MIAFSYFLKTELTPVIMEVPNPLLNVDITIFYLLAELK